MIRVENLFFRYAGSRRDALEALTATFIEGSMTAMMGSNGSGKSTLARCLNGLLQPASGSVSVDGLDTKDTGSLPEIRRRVGMVFQEPLHQMTSATVERELAFGLENLSVETAEMHRRVKEQAERFGLDLALDSPPGSLSAGDQQQLAAASVLILHPSYLILDEATSLLSVQARKKVLDAALAARSARNMGLLLITQFPLEAMLADRLIVLDKGRMVFDGNPAGLFQHHAADLLKTGVSVPLKCRLSPPP